MCFFGITGIFDVFLGHKVFKNNIWIKNYIGEEILDGWANDSKIGVETKKLCYFCDCAKFGQDGLLSTY